MQTVYFISGLGADERAFSFLDLSFCHPVFIKWIKPGKSESIASYAARLKEQIADEHPILVGLSFGGMISVEFAKQFACKKVILLASAKTQKEIPPYLRLLRFLPIHKMVTPAFLRAGNYFAYRLMGIHNRADKVIFTRMLNESDDSFLMWAVNAIVNWKNMIVPAHTVHIHGTKDILLPFRYIKANYTIAGGEHLMVMNKPFEVAAILRELLEDIK